MEDERRKSTRNIIIKQDPAFKYDDESIKFLVNTSESRGVDIEHRHHRISNAAAAATVAAGSSICANNTEKFAPIPPHLWAKAFKSLPLISNTVSESVNILSGNSLVNPSASQISGAECSAPNSFSSVVNLSPVASRALYGEVQCRVSSTDADFLDADDNIFLAVSPTSHSEIAGMALEDEVVGGSDKCECSGDNSCSDCATGKAAGAPVKAIAAPPQLSDIMALLQNMNKTVNTLTEDVSNLKENFGVQASKIEQLEAMSRASSRASSRVATSCDEARTSQGPSGSQGVKSSKKSNSKSKQSRQDEEKIRSLQVVSNQLKELKEKQSRDKDSQAGAESSDDSLFNVKALKKKMSKREKQACDLKVSDRLEQAGGFFPEDDSSSSNGGPNSSGTESESGRRRRSRRKVKSGADVKKRPVIRTYLWPHTVANEEDDEDLTCDTIGLPRFLSCFTLIMLNCGKVEKAGRANFLNAFSAVYECLPWTEARSFHNMVMLRLEQGEISWQEDFLKLAHKFLDRKVRQSLRTRSTVAGSSSYNKSGRRYSSYSKGKALYGSVCKSWNRGVCTYGEKCKFKHVCWTCFEAGKTGEQHKALFHSNSAGSKSQG